MKYNRSDCTEARLRRKLYSVLQYNVDSLCAVIICLFITSTTYTRIIKLIDILHFLRQRRKSEVSMQKAKTLC